MRIRGIPSLLNDIAGSAIRTAVRSKNPHDKATSLGEQDSPDRLLNGANTSGSKAGTQSAHTCGGEVDSLGFCTLLLIGSLSAEFRPRRSDVSRAERLRSLTENREVAVINEEAASLSTGNFFQYSEPLQMFHRV